MTLTEKAYTKSGAESLISLHDIELHSQTLCSLLHRYMYYGASSTELNVITARAPYATIGFKLLYDSDMLLFFTSKLPEDTAPTITSRNRHTDTTNMRWQTSGIDFYGADISIKDAMLQPRNKSRCSG
jgi:hypothetical protein